jgi:hypothetical protein
LSHENLKFPYEGILELANAGIIIVSRLMAAWFIDQSQSCLPFNIGIIKITKFIYIEKMNLFKKKIASRLLLITFFLGNIIFLKAQQAVNGPTVFLSPRITLGYTFGSGLNYGFDAVIGLYKMNEYKFGINLTYNMVNTDQGHHRIKGLAVVAESDYFCLKLGAGSISRRWGFKNMNKASAPVLLVDVSINIGEANAPWIGAKSFIFDHERWEFYDHPSYFSAYTYFKSPDIVILEQKITSGSNQ